MPRRYLITGSSGFWGSHLAPVLLKKGYQVFGTYRHRQPSSEGLTPVPCDLHNRDAIRGVVSSSRPDVVFHLAAQAYVPASWKDFEGTFRTNVFGTYYLLEALREQKLNCRVIMLGSSSEFGTLKEGETKFDESHAFQPSSPYGLSKVASDLLAKMYCELFLLPVIRVVPFYVIGPKKEPDAPSDFAKAIVRIQRGEAKELSVGNLSAVRDVVDIRDAIRALLLIEEKGELGSAYNICTGKGTSLREILEKMISLSGLNLKAAVDPARLRAGDDSRVIGDPTRMKGLGWQPIIPLGETLKSILDYWSEIHAFS